MLQFKLYMESVFDPSTARKLLFNGVLSCDKNLRLHLKMFYYKFARHKIKSKVTLRFIQHLDIT